MTFSRKTYSAVFWASKTCWEATLCIYQPIYIPLPSQIFRQVCLHQLARTLHIFQNFLWGFAEVLRGFALNVPRRIRFFLYLAPHDYGVTDCVSIIADMQRKLVGRYLDLGSKGRIAYEVGQIGT